MLAPATRWGFYEFSRRAGDFAIAMSLAAYRIESKTQSPGPGVVAGPEARYLARHASRFDLWHNGQRLGEFTNLRSYRSFIEYVRNNAFRYAVLITPNRSSE